MNETYFVLLILVNSLGTFCCVNLPDLFPNLFRYDYDILICSAGAETAVNEIFPNNQQTLFVQTEEFSKLIQLSFHNSGVLRNTLLYLVPTNFSEMDNLIQIVSPIFDFELGQSTDTTTLVIFRWPEHLLQSNCSLEPQMLNAFRNKFPFHSEVYILYEEMQNGTLINGLCEVFSYRVGNHSNIFVNQLSSLCQATGVCPIGSLYGRRWKNMNGMTIRFGFKDSFGNALGGIDTIQLENHTWVTKIKEGHYVEIVRDFQIMLHFRIHGIMGEGTITLLPNDSVGGNGALLYNDLIDVVVPYHTCIPYRVRHLTPLIPFFAFRLEAFFMQPELLSQNIYQRPFQESVWMFLICLLAVTTITTVFISWTENLVHQNNNAWVQFSIGGIVLSLVSAISQKGWYVEKSPTKISISSRLMILTILFTSFVLYTAYSGLIVSILAVQIVPIHSFKHLLAYDFKILFHPTNTGPKLLNNFTETEFSQLADRRNDYINDLLSIQDVLVNKTALITQEINFNAAMSKYGHDGKCSKVSRMLITQSSTGVTSVMLVRKGSQIKKLFNVGTIVLKQSGIMYRHGKLSYQAADVLSCPENPHIYRGNLGLSDVGVAFVILIGGCCFSLLELIIEKLKLF